MMKSIILITNSTTQSITILTTSKQTTTCIHMFWQNCILCYRWNRLQKYIYFSCRNKIRCSLVMRIRKHQREYLLGHCLSCITLFFNFFLYLKEMNNIILDSGNARSNIFSLYIYIIIFKNNIYSNKNKNKYK